MALPSKTEYLAQLIAEKCSICYEAINGPFRTSCNHIFCAECLKTWLDSSNTCPSCRTELYEAPAGEEPTDLEEDGGPEPGTSEHESTMADSMASMNYRIVRALGEELQATVDRIEVDLQHARDDAQRETLVARLNEAYPLLERFRPILGGETEVEEA